MPLLCSQNLATKVNELLEEPAKGSEIDDKRKEKDEKKKKKKEKDARKDTGKVRDGSEIRIRKDKSENEEKSIEQTE